MERCGQQQRQVERTSHGSQIDQPVDNLRRLASRQPIADDGEEMGVERRVACGEALLLRKRVARSSMSMQEQ
jgi:hypothetical protein